MEALRRVDQVTSIHPSHLYVVASLPLQYQESLRSQLEKIEGRWEAADR